MVVTGAAADPGDRSDACRPGACAPTSTGSGGLRPLRSFNGDDGAWCCWLHLRGCSSDSARTAAACSGPDPPLGTAGSNGVPARGRPPLSGRGGPLSPRAALPASRTAATGTLAGRGRTAAPERRCRSRLLPPLAHPGARPSQRTREYPAVAAGQYSPVAGGHRTLRRPPVTQLCPHRPHHPGLEPADSYDGVNWFRWTTISRKETHVGGDADRQWSLRAPGNAVHHPAAHCQAPWRRHDPGSRRHDPGSHRRDASSRQRPGVGQQGGAGRGPASPAGLRRRARRTLRHRHRASDRTDLLLLGLPGHAPGAGPRHHR